MAEKKTENLPVKAEAEPVEAVLVEAAGVDIDMPPEQIAELVERRLESRRRVLLATLKVVGKNAFTRHGREGDPDAKASLNGEAVMRLAPILGIVVEFNTDLSGDMAFRRRDGKDDDPDEPRFYDVEISGTGYYVDRPKMKVSMTGSASSRDGFFKRKGGDRVSRRQPMEAVSEGNLRKKAQTNLWARIGQVLLGVKGLSIGEIEAAGYSLEGSVGIAHDGKGASRAPMRTPRPASAEPRGDIKKKIGHVLMEMAGNDKQIASGMLADFTRFEGRDGPVQVESLSDPKFTDKWRFRTWGEKIKPAYAEWKAKQETAPPPPDGELSFPDDPPPMPEEETPF